MPAKTLSNILAGGVAITALVLGVMGHMDLWQSGLFIAVGVAELVD